MRLSHYYERNSLRVPLHEAVACFLWYRTGLGQGLGPRPRRVWVGGVFYQPRCGGRCAAGSVQRASQRSDGGSGGVRGSVNTRAL
jgi:hypothetical protein